MPEMRPGVTGALSLPLSCTVLEADAAQAAQQRVSAAGPALDLRYPTEKTGHSQSRVDRHCSFLQRYDFVSTCTGALCVTTYCVSRGQSPVLALTITAVATISALVRALQCSAFMLLPTLCCAV